MSILRYVFLRSGSSTTFRLHDLQGGTTSFEDLRLRSPLISRLGSGPFQRFTARRAPLGTSLVMYSQVFMDKFVVSILEADVEEADPEFELFFNHNGMALAREVADAI